MALRVCYIGEPIAATGFALIGAQIHTPDAEPRSVWDIVMRARTESDLIILNQSHAESIQHRLDELIEHEPIPPMMIISSIASDEITSDQLVRQARTILGIS